MWFKVLKSKGDASDPVFRRERARKAGQAAHSTDVLIRAILERRGELTAEQRQRIVLGLVAGNPDGAQ